MWMLLAIALPMLAGEPWLLGGPRTGRPGRILWWGLPA